MIPEFDEDGNLPPGVHWAEWEEFKDRFGTTPRRSRMIDGLQMAFLATKSSRMQDNFNRWWLSSHKPKVQEKNKRTETHSPYQDKRLNSQ